MSKARRGHRACQPCHGWGFALKHILTGLVLAPFTLGTSLLMTPYMMHIIRAACGRRSAAQ